MMRVFVAGATGAIGKQLVPRLVAAGHEVVGMTHSASKRALLRELAAEPVVADALDPDEGAAVRGAELWRVVVCAHRRTGEERGGPTRPDSGSRDARERGHRGVYNVVDDDPAPVAGWLPALAHTLGAKKPMRVPRFIGRLFAGEAGAVMMTEARGASNAKAKRELAWRPAHPSWREGFAT